MKKSFLSFVMWLGLSLNLAMAASSGIKNFSEVSDGIYRGGRPLTDDEFKTLKDKGIKTILNLQGGDSFSSALQWYQPGEQPGVLARAKATSAALELKYKNIQLTSVKTFKAEDDAKVNQILEFMHDPNNHPIYVHCEHGKDRTGMIVALYRMKYEGMSEQEAMKEWNDMGHGWKNRMIGALDAYFYKKAESIREGYETISNAKEMTCQEAAGYFTPF